MVESREIWKSVSNYEGLYEISNFGRVKSLSRMVERKSGRLLPIRERILRSSMTAGGYLHVVLSKNDIRETFLVHQLVWVHFGDGEKSNFKEHIDHKDADKCNNHIGNLQRLSARMNTNKAYKQNGKDLPSGVSYHKPLQKYRAQAKVNGVNKHLGYFDTVEDAQLAYLSAIRRAA
jgi:hypothetical protein